MCVSFLGYLRCNAYTKHQKKSISQPGNVPSTTMSPSSTIAIPAGSNGTVEVESPFTMLTRATAESAMTGSSTSSVWKAWELHEHNQINNIKIQTRCIKTYIPQLEKQGHLHASRQVGLEVQLYVYCQYRSDPGKRQNCLSGLKDKSTDERGEEIWSKKKSSKLGLNY